MQIILLLIFIFSSLQTVALETDEPTQVVTIPYMERPAVHRDFADVLLQLALQISEDKYGPYKIVQQKQQTVMLRQLQELEKGEHLTVAISMPMAESLERAQNIQFPVLKGLSSYRMFLVHRHHLARINNIDTLTALKTLKVGQGPGWSTAAILENNGFEVVYSGRYSTLVPMLKADRFQLLMRAVYEIGPEFIVFKTDFPELEMADEIAVFTYLPMYYFVSKTQPLLIERLDYGLKKAYSSGQYDVLYKQYFGDALKLMFAKQRKIFYLENTNIDRSFFDMDKPYLMDSIIKMEQTRRATK